MGWFDFLSNASPEELNQAGISPETQNKIQMQNAQAMPAQQENHPTTNTPVADGTNAPVMLDNGQIEDPNMTDSKAEGRLQLQKQQEAARLHDEELAAKAELERIEQEKKRDEMLKKSGFTQEQIDQQKAKIAPPEVAPVEEVEPVEPELTAEEKAAFDQQTRALINQQKSEASAQSWVDRKLNEYERQLNDLKNRKVDPNRWMNSRTVGQKIWAAFGIGFGGAGGAAIISNAIQNDVKSQQDEIDNEYRILREKGDMIKLGAQIYKNGTPDVAALDHKVKLLNVAIDQGKKFAAKPGANQGQVQNTIAQLERERDSTISSLSQTVRKKGGALTDNMIDGNTPMHFMDDNQKERHVTGYGLAKSPKAAQDFTASAVKAKTAIDGLTRILKLSREGNRLSPKDRSVLQTEILASAGTLKDKLIGSGAMSDKEFDRIIDTIGNPNKIFAFKENEEAKIKTLLYKLQNDLDIEAGLTFPNAPKTKFSSFKKSE